MVVRHDRLRADLATRRGRLKWIGIWTIATALGWLITGTFVALWFRSGDLDQGGISNTAAIAAVLGAGALAGAPIGIGQWLVLKRWIPSASRWIVATTLGWLFAFPIGLITGFMAGFFFAFILISLDGPGSLLVIVGFTTGLAAGGVFLGMSQGLLLRNWVGGAGQWIPVTVIGGVLISCGLTLGTYMVRGCTTAGLSEVCGIIESPYMSVLLPCTLGICLFGAFTGWQLVRLLRQTPAAE